MLKLYEDEYVTLLAAPHWPSFGPYEVLERYMRSESGVRVDTWRLSPEERDALLRWLRAVAPDEAAAAVAP